MTSTVHPSPSPRPRGAGAGAYDEVELVVWSGTGNSRRVAEWVAAAARTGGAATVVRSAPRMEQATDAPARALDGADGKDEGPPARRLLGLLGPTHGFTAPWPVVRAAATTPRVWGVDAFVLMTRGAMRAGRWTLPGFEGTAALLPAALLALRGARVRGMGAIDMPQNWTLVIPAAAPAAVAAIVARGEAQTDAFAARILGGERAFGGWVQAAVGAMMLPLSLAYLVIARLVLAKAFYADESCTSCGACVAGCPHGAIRLLGPARRPYWTFACHNCMRCMARCPKEAIQGAQGWLLFYAYLAGLPVTAAVMEGIGVSAGWPSVAGRLLVGFGWIVVTVWMAYGLLWLGLGTPGLRWLLERATLTRWYRRYRGPGRMEQ